jgi:hypothetical protein
MSTEPNEPMGVPRAVLLVNAAIFVAFGVAFLLAPVKIGSWIDLTPSANTGRTELRAFYGGLELGWGAFFALAALRKQWHVPALVAALLGYVGLAAARIYGISVEGGASMVTVLTLLAEVAAASVSAWALVKTRAPELGPADDLDAKFKALERDMKPKPIERTKPLRIERTEQLEKAKPK